MKILAVSLAFPPLAYPRSIQVARLLRHLDAETVLVCADEPGARLDNTIEPEAEGLLSACLRVPVKRGRLDSVINSVAHRFAKPVWNRRNLVPDQYLDWGRSAVQSALDHLDGSSFKPDRIVTFAQPFTDHLVGLELKKKLGLPWLAYFSDPWTDNPFAAHDENTRRANLELERSVTEKADALVFTSAETVDLYFRKYETVLREKAAVVPQCFETDRFPESRPKNRGKITIRYLGNFYGKRTPAPLIRALEQLAQKQPRMIEDVSFELVGSGDRAEVDGLAARLPEGLFSMRGTVDYSKSLQLMSDSDGLLLIDAAAELSVFLPSKLIDYIGSGVPVFGITPPGAAATLITELGGESADPSDLELLHSKLSEFISYLKRRRSSGEVRPWGVSEVRTRFRATQIAADFRKILEKLDL